jgi:glutamyl/glutaminyl-tRNA synthetase
VDKVKAKGWKVGDFFMSLRIAVCGSRATPPLTDTMLILGKQESLSRIQNALKYLGQLDLPAGKAGIRN